MEVVIIKIPGLRFNRVSGILPGSETTQESLHVGKSILLKQKCRTGTRFFSRSGAVGDDVLVRIKLAQAGFKLAVRNIERAGNVKSIIIFRIPDIDDDGCA